MSRTGGAGCTAGCLPAHLPSRILLLSPPPPRPLLLLTPQVVLLQAPVSSQGDSSSLESPSNPKAPWQPPCARDASNHRPSWSVLFLLLFLSPGNRLVNRNLLRELSSLDSPLLIILFLLLILFPRVQTVVSGWVKDGPVVQNVVLCTVLFYVLYL